MSASSLLDKPKKKLTKTKLVQGLNGAAIPVDISEFANRTFPDPLGRSWEQVLLDRERIVGNCPPLFLLPDGMSLRDAIIGQWPGDESDEEIELLLKEIS